MKNDDFEVLRGMMLRNRSYRRFDSSVAVGEDTLCRLVGLARLCASGRNLQPLRYRLVTDAGERDALFPALKWAGYLADWAGPAEDERPAAYLVQCLDTQLTTSLLCDDGLQLEAITLGATALGLGCCIIKSFNAAAVSAALGLDRRYTVQYVVALGVPAEKVVIEPMRADGNYGADCRYWRDAEGVHHVPKLAADELIIGSGAKV